MKFLSKEVAREWSNKGRRDGRSKDVRSVYVQHAVNVRSVYVQHAVNTRSVYVQHAVNVRSVYMQHAVNRKVIPRKQ